MVNAGTMVLKKPGTPEFYFLEFSVSNFAICCFLGRNFLAIASNLGSRLSATVWIAYGFQNQLIY